MKVKILLGAAALSAATLLPAGAMMRMTPDQLDAITAGQGLELGPMYTVIADPLGYPDTYNVLNPNFTWGSDVIYFAPLGGPLFSSYSVNLGSVPNYTTH